MVHHGQTAHCGGLSISLLSTLNLEYLCKSCYYLKVDLLNTGFWVSVKPVLIRFLQEAISVIYQ